MISTPIVTLDTSCVISFMRLPGDSTPADEIHALEQIQKWHIEGQITLMISEKSRSESLANLEKANNLNPNDRARSEKWLQTLRILAGYEAVTGRWILGLSRLGIDTILGSNAENQAYEDMAQVLYGKSPSHLKEGDVYDLAILFEHFTEKNDLFVTRDAKSRMLQKKCDLKQKWNIIVCDPIEAQRILASSF